MGCDVDVHLQRLVSTVVSSLSLTRYGGEEFDGISVSVEAQLGVSHGAERYEAAGRRALSAVVVVHPHRSPGVLFGHHACCLVDCNDTGTPAVVPSVRVR